MACVWKSGACFLVAFVAVGTAAFVGGLSKVSLHDKHVKDALTFAVEDHNRKSNDMFVSQVQEVTEAMGQVVAGMKYYFKVKMVRTECRKNDVKPDCPVNSNAEVAKPYSCTLEVWSRPWLNDIRLIKNECM